MEEVGQGISSGGRPPSLLRLNDKANYVIGLKLMGHAISLVVTDLRAAVIYTQVTPLPERAAATAGPAPREPEVVIAAVCEAVQTAILATAVAPDRIIGVGVGVAGAIDANTGVCLYSNTFNWHNVALAQPISQRLGLPVILENDANTLTATEQWFGLGHGVEKIQPGRPLRHCGQRPTSSRRSGSSRRVRPYPARGRWPGVHVRQERVCGGLGVRQGDPAGHPRRCEPGHGDIIA